MYSPETGRFTSKDSWLGDYNRPPCQSKTSSQVKPSPKKNFNATPSAFGTSPEYDKKRSECGFKIYIVIFGGG
jgi:hypothetical protein